MIYTRTQPGKQKKMSALVSVYVSETVNKNSFPVMIYTRTDTGKQKKSSPCAEIFIHAYARLISSAYCIMCFESFQLIRITLINKIFTSISTHLVFLKSLIHH